MITESVKKEAEVVFYGILLYINLKLGIPGFGFGKESTGKGIKAKG